MRLPCIVAPLGLDAVGIEHRQPVAISVVVEGERLAIGVLNADEPLQLVVVGIGAPAAAVGCHARQSAAGVVGGLACAIG